MPYESTIFTYMRYFHAVLSKFACAISNFQNKLLFCVFVSLTERWGWLIFSMLDVLFSRWVFIRLSLHESKAKVLAMPSPEMQKWIYFMLSNNKFLRKCWYGGQPWIRLAMESEKMVEKGINFIFCLGTAYGISSREIVRSSMSFSLVGWIHLPKCFYLYFFALSSRTSTNPYFPLRRAILLLYAIFILKFESPSSLIKSTN